MMTCGGVEGERAEQELEAEWATTLETETEGKHKHAKEEVKTAEAQRNITNEAKAEWLREEVACRHWEEDNGGGETFWRRKPRRGDWPTRPRWRG